MKPPPSNVQPNRGDAVSEDELHALVDERLSAQQQAELRRRLLSDPQASATVDAFGAQRAALRGLYASALHEPVPASLTRAGAGADRRRQTAEQAWRLGGIAAAVTLAFGLGWLSHDRVDVAVLSRNAARGAQLAQSDQQFVRQASLAHAVYAPEVRHPVEVTVAQQEHLVQWLSKRLGRPLKVPQLAPLGYELVGGRLLPGDSGARAQFMFQNAAGARITLYLGSVDASQAAGRAQETAFRFAAQGAVNSFYWMDQGFGYALAAELPREELQRLAQLVYQQL